MANIHVQQIFERLDYIEKNQERLEDMVIFKQTEEIAELREMIQQQKIQQENTSNKTPVSAGTGVVSAENIVEHSYRTLPFLTEGSPSNKEEARILTLDDVEKAVSSHPSVSVARAFRLVQPGRETELCCAIRIKDGMQVSDSCLKMHIQNHLPINWIPTHFYMHKELTKTTARSHLADDRTLAKVPSKLVSPRQKPFSPRWIQERLTRSKKS